MNKQVQAGQAKDFSEAFENVFQRPGAVRYYFAAWTAILVRDVPYGAAASQRARLKGEHGTWTESFVPFVMSPHNLSPTLGLLLDKRCFGS